MPRTCVPWLIALALVGAPWVFGQAGSGSSRDSDTFAEYKEDLLSRFPAMAPRVGELAVDHTGIDLDGSPVRLSDLWARKPVVLEFGTCT